MPMVYHCRYFPALGVDWGSIEGIKLVETVTGEPPRLSTVVKACWTKDHIRISFECEDDHVVSSYTKRDDPIYRQDVVEAFIDETGSGRTYLEFEISPYNVVFDARIEKEKYEKPKVDAAWNAEGLVTESSAEKDGFRRYELAIPFHNFKSTPRAGDEWRVNFYRIDQDLSGKRHYWAWSLTGAIDFHIPESFGFLRFV